MNQVPRIARVVMMVGLLGLALSAFVEPMAAQGKRKPRAAKGKKAPIMLTDQEIKDALKEGADIAFVKTETIEVEAPGTRGHQTFYKLKIITNMVGKPDGTIEASRYGAPVLQKGQAAIVVLQDLNRGEYKLLAYTIVPEGKQDEVIKAHVERIEKLKTAK